jgi:carbamoyltransferase
MKRNYIGLANTHHDSALAVVNSQGEVVFAEATERYLQYKRAINVRPDLCMRTMSVVRKHCEPGAELVPAFSWSLDMHTAMSEQVRSVAESRQAITSKYGALAEDLDRELTAKLFMFSSQLLSLSEPGLVLNLELSQAGSEQFRRGSSRHFDHHATHAATGCFSSPFEDAACAIIDGFGETRSLSCYAYKQGKVIELESEKRGKTMSMVSLGFFYEALCKACGFDPMGGEEWKVMGLAPYGEMDPKIYELLKSLIWVNDLTLESPNAYAAKAIWHKLIPYMRKPGEPSISVANLAFAGQKVFTEVVLQLLRNLYDKGISDNLVLGGGCALNSSTNGQILGATGFKNLHVFAAPADDGNAIGAALLAYQLDHATTAPRPLLTPYLGSTVSRDTLNNVKQFGRIPKLTECNGAAPERAAEILSRGGIIGWVQGRAEFGPRALGNRSILADPTAPDIKDRINGTVKFREEFRPFAPSILHEFGPEYFESYQESPYMERTLKFRKEVAGRVPGVVHHDGTGRLQTVKKEWNESYFRLIDRFRQLTGVPLVLNTSFNVMGKPIAHSVEDVLAVFYTSGLDAVFIDDVLIEK